MKTLPKYYYIKRDESNPLWKKYDKWTRDNGLNLLFGSIWDYIGFDGSINNNGFNGTNKIEYFKNNAELITLEFWDECVNGRKIVGYKLVKTYPFRTFPLNEINNNPNSFDECALYPEFWEAVYEEEKLEVVHWYNDSITSQINFKGLLTQEKVDKIKEVINE